MCRSRKNDQADQVNQHQSPCRVAMTKTPSRKRPCLGYLCVLIVLVATAANISIELVRRLVPLPVDCGLQEKSDAPPRVSKAETPLPVPALKGDNPEWDQRPLDPLSGIQTRESFSRVHPEALDKAWMAVFGRTLKPQGPSTTESKGNNRESMAP